ncbi:MAG TPA: metal ABC transporter substrate-binding protein, partial [Terrimicrobiaceae bacterium]
GVDPHEFQLSPFDVRQIEGADLVLLSGKGMEGYLTKLKDAVEHKEKFVDVGAVIPSLKLKEHGEIIEDPHWWQSIENVKKATIEIKKRFVQADPANQSAFETNANHYLAQLSELQKWAKREISQLPPEGRKLVTSHDAFHYFARDYGFEIYAIDGVSTEDQPSSKKVAALIKTVRDQGVKAVFFESIENREVVREITKETNAKIGGELFADGLQNKEGSTYSDTFRHNVTTIVQSLR